MKKLFFIIVSVFAITTLLMIQLVESQILNPATSFPYWNADETYFIYDNTGYLPNGINSGGYVLAVGDNRPVPDDEMKRYISDASNMNLSVIRIFLNSGWVDLESSGIGNYNSSILDRIDKIISYAKSERIFVSVNIFHFWEGLKPYLVKYGIVDPSMTTEELLAGDEWQEFFSNPGVRNNFKNRINFLLNHENPYTGLKWKDEPSIFSFTMVSEPPDWIIENKPENYTLFMRDVISYFRSIDGNHLVTDGGTCDYLMRFSKSFIDGSEPAGQPDYIVKHMYAAQVGVEGLANDIQEIGDMINWENGLKASNNIRVPILLEEIGVDYSTDNEKEQFYSQVLDYAKLKQMSIFIWSMDTCSGYLTGNCLSNSFVVNYEKTPLTASTVRNRSAAVKALSSYGNMFAISGHSKVALSGQNIKASIRFTAWQSKQLRKVYFYTGWTPNPPTYRIGIQSDNGSGRPSGTWLNSVVVSGLTGNVWQNISLNLSLVAGQVYHIVFQWESGSIAYGRQTTLLATTPLNKLLPKNQIRDQNQNVLVSVDSGVTWNTLNAQPIYILEFSDGTLEGQPYINHGVYSRITGSRFEGELIQPEQDLRIKGVSFFVGKAGSPQDNLYLNIYDVSAGRLLLREQIARPTDITSGWTLLYRLQNPLTLTSNRRYRVYLSSPNSATYGYALPTLNNSTSTFNSETFDGIRSYRIYSTNGGVSWTSDLGRDISFYFISE